jgi:7-cyano-7-deazaguanine synthase
MAYHLVALGLRPRLVSFDYGQRHRKELMYAERAAYDLDLDWNLIDLSSLTSLFTSSALTFGKDVPEGHYAEDNMAVTVVPNRNMIMLSIAAGIAVNDELKYVAAGMHAGDHAQYPDCRPEFIDSLTQTLREANRGFIRRDFQVLTPWIFKTKDDIAREAWSHNVPLDMTWSCYQGGKNHCGRCGTCVERLEAIASVREAPEGWDNTVYDDGEFWKAAVAEFRTSK